MLKKVKSILPLLALFGSLFAVNVVYADDQGCSSFFDLGDGTFTSCDLGWILGERTCCCDRIRMDTLELVSNVCIPVGGE